jgi:hypothetical protein
MTRMKTLSIVFAGLGLALAACSDDPPGNTSGGVGGDAGTSSSGGSSSGMMTMDRAECVSYCDAIVGACSGANAQYNSKEDCVAYCNASNWPKGVDGEQANNTVACRIYHAGVAKDEPVSHCPHAGPSGDGVCGSLAFQNDAVPTFVRVDRMGMPAVATALILAADKNAYNDGNPENDATAFAGKFIASLTGIHDALDADLIAKGFVPCSMTTMIGSLPECLGQEYAAGKTVASLVVPFDAIKIDITQASGFPNGRQLQDPVIDVTLAVLLLKLSATQSAVTFAMKPLNPAKNDINGGVFGAEFPYFLPKQK